MRDEMHKLSRIAPWTVASEKKGELPVALISLTSSCLRRQVLFERGVSNNWVKNFWPATDLRTADVRQIENICNLTKIKEHMGRPVRSTEMGCALSHHAVASWLRSTPHDLALVLEDDFIPEGPDFEAQIVGIAEALRPHAQKGGAFICHLGAPRGQTEPALKRRVTFSSSPGAASLPMLYLHADPDRTVWRAHAYLLSRGAAERARRIERKTSTLADDWCERRRLGMIDEIFYTDPIVVRQDEEMPSTIRPSDHNEHYIAPSPSGPFLVRFRRAILDRRLLERSVKSIQFRTKMTTARVYARFSYKLP